MRVEGWKTWRRNESKQGETQKNNNFIIIFLLHHRPIINFGNMI